MAANGISTLATKELRQKAKLALASLKRQGYTLNDDGTANFGSVQFSGSNYLSVAGGLGTAMGTGDFTWEAWVYPTSSSGYQAFIDTRTLPLAGGSTDGFYFGTNDNTLTPIYYTNGLQLASSINITLNAWNHVALTRASGTVTLWINGASGGTKSDITDLIQQRVLVGGATDGNATGLLLTGNISNLRIVKGTALYTATFTPSTSPFKAIDGTQLLLNTDNGANFLKDSSTNNFTVTNTGAVTSSASGPGPDTNAAFYRSRATYDITQLHTQYDDNGIIDNANTDGLVLGRPWVAVVNPAPVTQDLILFFDSERTDCYSGTGTTIYNLVDNTPSTLFGDITYSNGTLRIHNENTSNPGLRISGIQCQTVTGFKTISLWYKQITSSAGYYSYILDARGGMPGGWVYDTPSNDYFGESWASGTMFINGGASQQPNYTQQLNVWRNVTFVTDGTAFTDDITLFSRVTQEEGLDVEFGACMIYSRAITEAENKQNYDQFKTRYPSTTVTSGLRLHLDAGNTASYTSGTTWTDLSTNTNDATLVGSPAFTSAGTSSYFTFPNDSGKYATTPYTKYSGTPGDTNGSVLFSTSPSQYLSVPNNAAFTQNQPFTIETWFYPTNITGGYIWAMNQPNFLTMTYRSSGKFQIDMSFVGPPPGYTTLDTTYPINNWYHIALTWNGTNGALWINGAQESTFTGAGATVAGGNAFYIGQYQNENVTTPLGNLSNFRVVKGVAVYTGAFTPPTAPLTVTQSSGTNISSITAGQTQLLLNTVSGANFLTDASTNAFTVTNNGSVTSSALNPFSGIYTGKSTFFVARMDAGIADGYHGIFGTNITGRTFNTYIYKQAGSVYQVHASFGGVGTNGWSDNLTLTTGQWFTFGATQAANGNITFYFNGQAVGVTTGLSFTNTYSSGTDPQLIGKADDGTLWHGDVAVATVYDRTLSGAEMLQNHNAIVGRYGL